jgi:hypothetical protein
MKADFLMAPTTFDLDRAQIFSGAVNLVRLKQKYLFPLVMVTVAKLAIVGWILERPFSEGHWFGPYGYAGSWYVFLGWDSPFYLGLAQIGYPSANASQNLSYAFLPAYPGLIRISYYLFHDYLAAAAVSAFVLGIASILIFQLVAEFYLPKGEALAATIIFAFFPYVFVFTSLAYTESLFLFATLASWLFHKRGQTWISMCFAIVATMTRLYGILIVIPIAIDLIRTHKIRRIVGLVAPFGALACWCYYCYLQTGDWFAPLTSERVAWGTKGWAEGYLLGLFTGNMASPNYGIIALIPFLAVSGILLLLLMRIDFALSAYSTSLFVLLLITGATLSMGRFISFIFPIWYAVTVNDLRLVLACVPFFILVSAALWYEFTLGLWVA